MIHHHTVSIVFLSHNRIDDLRKMLPLLVAEAQESGAEIIALDNASTDGSAEFLESFSQEYGINFIRSDINLDIPAGLNRVYKAAKGEYIISIDDDTYIKQGLVAQTIAAFEKYSDAGIIAYRIQHHTTGEDQNPLGEESCEVATYHGAGHAFRRSVFDAIGYMDELHTYGGGELDTSLRARIAGFGVRYVPEIVVGHNSYKRPGKTGLHRRIRWRSNYTHLLYKYFPRRTAALYSFRLTAVDLIFGFKFGFGTWIKFWSAVLNGRKTGMRDHSPLPEHILKMYVDPSFRPAYGNIPLTQKLVSKLKR